MIAALYARVSTSDGRQSAENQIAALRAYAGRSGYTIFAEYVDHASGSLAEDNREELRRLMTDAHRRRFDIVLVFALDRFTREGVLHALDYLERLRGAGVQFRSITEEHFQTTGPAGELFLAIAAWVAKQERLRIRERISAGVARAKAAGIQFGRPRVLIDAKRIADLRAKGMSARAIAAELGIGAATIARRLKESEAGGNGETSTGDVRGVQDGAGSIVDADPRSNDGGSVPERARVQSAESGNRRRIRRNQSGHASGGLQES